MIHIDALNGYVADTPKVVFKRCDGKVYTFDEINSSSTSKTTNNITITGGWSNFPLAYIDTDKTMEITFESSQITMDMFELDAATNIEEVEEYELLDSDLFEVEGTTTGTGTEATESNLHILIPYQLVADSVKINALEDSAYTQGAYAAATTGENATPAGTTVNITGNPVAIGDTIRASYIKKLTDVAVVSDYTTSGSVKGELWLTWPVYSSGVDCNDAAIKGYLHRVFYRVRATASPSLDSSYKSAATSSMTFAAIDPRRPDKKISEWIYEENNADNV